MEKEKIILTELTEGSKYTKLKKAIKFIQENAGGITLITTSAIALGSVLIRYFSYLIECGKTMYYNIPRSLIDVSGDNILYDFFVKGIFALFFILLNLIPYFLWKGEKRIWSKLGLSLILVLSPEVLVILGLMVNGSRGIKYSIGDLGIFFLSGFIVGAIFFSAGLLNGICEHVYKLRQNKKKQNKEKRLSNSKKVTRIIVLFVLLIVVESVLIIFIGYLNAASKNQFKIIIDGDLTYAVIYENSEKYVISKCEIEDKQISFTDIETKKEIKKDDVEYTIQRLTQRKENVK